jgi:hypothetical protein
VLYPSELRALDLSPWRLLTVEILMVTINLTLLIILMT